MAIKKFSKKFSKTDFPGLQVSDGYIVCPPGDYRTIYAFNEKMHFLSDAKLANDAVFNCPCVFGNGVVLVRCRVASGSRFKKGSIVNFGSTVEMGCYFERGVKVSLDAKLIGAETLYLVENDGDSLASLIPMPDGHVAVLVNGRTATFKEAIVEALDKGFNLWRLHAIHAQALARARALQRQGVAQ